MIANIPYYITSAVIRHLLEAKIRPARLVLTMQKEVAERIVNRDEKMSLLSLSVLVYGIPESAVRFRLSVSFLPKSRFQRFGGGFI